MFSEQRFDINPNVKRLFVKYYRFLQKYTKVYSHCFRSSSVIVSERIGNGKKKKRIRIFNMRIFYEKKK